MEQDDGAECTVGERQAAIRQRDDNEIVHGGGLFGSGRHVWKPSSFRASPYRIMSTQRKIVTGTLLERLSHNHVIQYHSQCLTTRQCRPRLLELERGNFDNLEGKKVGQSPICILAPSFRGGAGKVPKNVIF